MTTGCPPVPAAARSGSPRCSVPAVVPRWPGCSPGRRSASSWAARSAVHRAGGGLRSGRWWSCRRTPDRCRARRPGVEPRPPELEQRLGLIPRAPRAVGMPGADPGGGAGEVSAGQRHHGKRCGLADFADRDAAAEADQRLLGQLGITGAGLLIPVSGGRAGRPRQDDDGRCDRGEQQRRRGTAGRHHPMLRMCLMVQMFRHAR